MTVAALPAGTVVTGRCLPLEAQGIQKRFGGVVALDGVDLSVAPSECVAVVGENGAGKSTLVRILSGVHRPDAGVIRLRGTETVIRDPRHARDLGIWLCHQELPVVPKLSVLENILLGRERTRLGLLADGSARRASVGRALESLGLSIPLSRPMGSLTVAEQQLVEISKALVHDAELIILDEPTAALAPTEVDRLFTALRRLLHEGRGLVYISHRIDEIGAIANRVVVMREGRVAGQLPPGSERGVVVSMMIGRDLRELYPRTRHSPGRVVLKVDRLRAGPIRDISFELHCGEVLGIGGLVGAGHQEVAEALFGEVPISTGSVTVDGRTQRLMTARRALRSGMALVAADRTRQGLNMKASIADNIVLSIADRLSRFGFISSRLARATAEGQIKRLQIRARSPHQPVRELSGGNQQKVVLGRALASRPKILVLVEPSRGIDLGARSEIYRQIDQLAQEQTGILLVTSDFDELQAMSDRALILYRGKVAGEVRQEEASRGLITSLATGGGVHDGD